MSNPPLGGTECSLRSYPGFFKINLCFIYLFLAVLGVHCYARAFSSCGERGLLFVGGAWASHCSGFSLRSTGSRRVGFSSCGARASVVVARGL